MRPVPRRLLLSIVLVVVAIRVSWTHACAGGDMERQDPSAPRESDQTAAPPDNATRSAHRKKASPRVPSTKKKAERSRPSKKTSERETGFVMEPGIVCKSID